jgi:hypothetical protein
MPFPSPSGPNSYIWNLKQVYNARLGNNWPTSGLGLFAGGYSNAYQNVINYITIATTGDSTDFGDLTLARAFGSGTSSTVRGIFGGTENASGNDNVIDYVTITTTGNATDFGDLSVNRSGTASCSNTHGGLI